MSTPESVRASAALALVLALSAGAGARAEGPGLGVEIAPGDLAAWDISVFPDGRGLPAGQGTAAGGAVIFAQKCAACHGENGKGATNSALINDRKLTSIDAAEKTIPNFWPYATTLFDYIRRSMPWQLPRSLSSDEVYALTAFILARNHLIAEDAVMNAQTLPQVRMPNRNGFIDRFPERM